MLLICCIPLAVLSESVNGTSSGISAPEESGDGEDGQSTPFSHAIMRPSAGELVQWYDDYLNQDLVTEEIGIAELDETQTTGYVSLLGFIDYNATERDQEQCGNCWVWASTGVVEIAHTQQNKVFDRLSIQYVNSRYHNGGHSPFSPMHYACNGGKVSDFVTFYNTIGKYGGNKMAVPWSNENAEYQDGNSLDTTSVPADTIQTNPHYTLHQMSGQRIETFGVPQSVAIANIKQVLNSGKGVYLSFAYPNNDGWQAFGTFWSGNSTEPITLDTYSGVEYGITGGAHGVLVTGYYDDGMNGYWECLNSWGGPSNRPDGVFRVSLNMDYSSFYTVGDDIVPAMLWQTINVGYLGSEPATDPDKNIFNLTPDFIVSPVSGYSPLTVHFTDTSNGSPISWKWDFGDGAGSALRNHNHTYSQPGRYSVSLLIGKGGTTAQTEQQDEVTVEYPYVKVSAFPRADAGSYPDPTDPDGDGRFEDINGNGWLEFDDPEVLLQNMEFAMSREPVLQFDFDSSGFIGYGDVVALRKMV